MGNVAPAVVFTYNRLKHTQETLRALNDCELAADTDLFIFCDNYKKEKDRESVENVRRFVEQFAEKNNFKSTTITKAAANKGLAKSITEGVTEIIDQYKTVIVVEDDLIASKFFLRYMNEALCFYQNSQRIWAISGYSFPMDALKDYPHDVYMSGRGCSWGWATWADRWETVDWDVKGYDQFKHNWIKREKFAAWGIDLPCLLDYQMNLDVNSWAIKWCFSAYTQGRLVVYPKRSYLKNCGIDGTGVHSQNVVSSKFDTDYDDTKAYCCSFENINVYERIRKEFAKKYSNGIWIDTKEKVKAFLVRNKLRQ